MIHFLQSFQSSDTPDCPQDLIVLLEGGAFRSEKWRSDVDNLVINVATDSCIGGWDKEDKKFFHPSEPGSTWSDFQLAALRALLASLISPTRVRPPYLAQGLELFRRGKQEIGTKVSEFCAHALLALEVLIHPRALPLINFSFATGNTFDVPKSRFHENMFSSAQIPNGFPNATLRNRPTDPDSEDDDLYNSWLRIGDESEAPVDEPVNASDNQKINSIVGEKQHSTENSSGAKVPEKSEQGTCLTCTLNTRGTGEEFLRATQVAQETQLQTDELNFPGGPTFALDGSLGIQSSKVASTSGASDTTDVEMTMGKNVMATSLGEQAVRIDTSAKYTAIASSGGTIKDFVFAVDNDASLDDIPDIIDVEPDSDEN